MAEDIQPSKLEAATTPRTLSDSTSKISGTLRTLRIAFSAVCGIICVLLIVLWVRSYSVTDVVYGWFPLPGYLQLNLSSGQVKLIANGERQKPEWHYESQESYPLRQTWIFKLDMSSRFGWWLDITVPHWFTVLLTAALSAAPWIRWSKRFSLRTLLVVVTLAAVLLGVVVYAIR